MRIQTRLKRQYLASLSKLQTDLQELMLLPFHTSLFGSHTNDIGVSTSHPSPSQSKKKTGQASEHGRGKTSMKSPESAISPTMEEHTGKPHTKSAQQSNTRSSKLRMPHIDWALFKEETDNVEGCS